MSGYIYIASPYSHPDVSVRNDRVLDVQSFAAWCAKRRMVVYSPIAHWHIPAFVGNLPTDAAFWWDQNRTMLDAATGVFVLRLKGWKRSLGVAQEIEYAKQIGKPVEHFAILVDGPGISFERVH